MPSGLTEQKKQISTMIDTGAGLNIGLLSYWQDFADKFPHLVKAFGPIDFSRYEKVIVGSVNKAAEGTVCTHFIELYTPLQENGQLVSLRIGLAENFAATLIIGLPFAVRARMALYLAEGYVFAQAVQRTFPLKYMTPVCHQTVPLQEDGADVQTFLAATNPLPSLLMDLPAQQE